MTSTRPPAGTRDFLPDDIRRREYVVGIIRSVYEQYGFEPLETPAFENIETLLGKYGDEGNKLIFKILKRGEHEASGEADLALRYDLTVPLARVVAQYQNELPKFFKRYQIQPVWRADRPARGRFREFYQCDVDTVGSTSVTAEAEQLSAVSEILSRLGFDDFTIRVNDRRVLASVLESVGIPNQLHGEALIAIDKLDKIGVAGVEKDLAARGIDARAVSACIVFFKNAEEAGASARDGLNWLSGSLADSDGLQSLRSLVDLSEGTAAAGKIRVDPSLARGLSYYTGAIMELAVPDLAGSLGAGGRYDNLIGMFLGREIPACGLSLGLERILLIMTERAMFPPAVVKRLVDVMITIWNDDSRADALALAADLRRSGLGVDVYLEADKLGKQFKYAASRQVPFVAVVGDEEKAANTVAIKDMTSGEQRTVRRDDLASVIKGRRQ
jgi:histidyl-tRNA synthetase